MKILYLHNFGDAERDSHYDILHRLFPDADIATVDTDYTETPLLDQIFDYECMRDVDCIVGNGFGGFLAYIAGIANDIKTVLINPYIPMGEYLTEIPYMNENRETFNSLWQNNRGKNMHCSVLLDTKTKIPDLDKTFNELKDIANVHIHCDAESLVYSKVYESWLKTTITDN